MSARASLSTSAVLALLPMVAAGLGLSRYLASASTSAPVEPVAGFCALAYEQTLDLAGHAGFGLFAVVMTAFFTRALFVVYRGYRERARLERVLEDRMAITSTVIQRLRDECPRGAAIDIVAADLPFAATLGYLKPRIVLSCRILETLTADELEAVIRHEFVHVARRDPLRILLAEFFRAGLPFLPVLYHLLRQFDLRKETEADEDVVRVMGSSAPLAGALSKVLGENDADTAHGAAGLSATEARIDQLLGVKQQRPSTLGALPVAGVSFVSLAVVSLTAFVLFSSPSIVTAHVCWPQGF